MVPVENLWLLIVVAGVPAMGYFIGLRLSRAGAPAAFARYRAVAGTIVGAYYAVLLLAGAGVAVFVSGRVGVDGAAGLGCLLIGASPVLAIVVVALGEMCGHSRNRGVCRTCGYDLRGLRSGRCPECGTASRSARGL